MRIREIGMNFMADRSIRKICILVILLISNYSVFSQVKSPGQRDVNFVVKPTSVTRGEILSKDQCEIYEKLIENGSTDENIAYQLGVHYKLFHDSWYSDEAEYYFLIGAKQDSPRCLYELAANLTLRDDDMSDVQSYDKLKELAELNIDEAKKYLNKIKQDTIRFLEMKRQGIIIDE